MTALGKLDPKTERRALAPREQDQLPPLKSYQVIGLTFEDNIRAQWMREHVREVNHSVGAAALPQLMPAARSARGSGSRRARVIGAGNDGFTVFDNPTMGASLASVGSVSAPGRSSSVTRDGFGSEFGGRGSTQEGGTPVSLILDGGGGGASEDGFGSIEESDAGGAGGAGGSGRGGGRGGRSSVGSTAAGRSSSQQARSSVAATQRERDRFSVGSLAPSFGDGLGELAEPSASLEQHRMAGGDGHHERGGAQHGGREMYFQPLEDPSPALPGRSFSEILAMGGGGAATAPPSPPLHGRHDGEGTVRGGQPPAMPITRSKTWSELNTVADGAAAGGSSGARAGTPRSPTQQQQQQQGGRPRHLKPGDPEFDDSVRAGGQAPSWHDAVAREKGIPPDPSDLILGQHAQAAAQQHHQGGARGPAGGAVPYGTSASDRNSNPHFHRGEGSASAAERGGSAGRALLTAEEAQQPVVPDLWFVGSGAGVATAVPGVPEVSSAAALSGSSTNLAPAHAVVGSSGAGGGGSASRNNGKSPLGPGGGSGHASSSAGGSRHGSAQYLLQQQLSAAAPAASPAGGASPLSTPNASASYPVSPSALRDFGGSSGRSEVLPPPSSPSSGRGSAPRRGSNCVVPVDEDV